jgi:hypothetical protein
MKTINAIIAVIAMMLFKRRRFMILTSVCRLDFSILSPLLEQLANHPTLLNR